MKTITLIITSIIIMAVNKIVAQDYFLSQPQESPILINPANTGIIYPARANLNYRQQWKSILSNPFTTIIASFDSKFLSQSSTGSSLGLGIYIANDQSGTAKLNTMNVNIAISGKVLINDNQNLSAGITGGIMQRKVNTDNLTFYDQYDGYAYNSSLAQETFSLEQRFAPDIGAGIQWSYGKGNSTLSSNDNIGAQLGIAAYHVNMPSTGFSEDIDKRYIRFLAHGSFAYGFKNTNFQLNPIVIAQMQGPAKMYYGGMYIKYRLQESSKYTNNLLSRSLNLGGFYRLGDSFVTVFQLEWDKFAYGISYDLNISKLNKVSKGHGGIEFSLRYIPLKPNVANRLL